jgi:DNA-directed RNA polymerase subunit RPC12/RpoP
MHGIANPENRQFKSDSHFQQRKLMEYTCTKCGTTHSNMFEQTQNDVIWKVYTCPNPECGSVLSEWDRVIETNIDN